MLALTITITGDIHIGMRMTRTMNMNRAITTGGGDLRGDFGEYRLDGMNRRYAKGFELAFHLCDAR
jgi:hypothetical protein